MVTISDVLFHSASTRENREFISSLCIVTEWKVFSNTEGKDENVKSTQVDYAGGKDEVQQNVENKGTYLIY